MEQLWQKMHCSVQNAEPRLIKGVHIMQKTKLGISVGLLGAIIYFTSLFGSSYLIAILLCGYILLVEDNPWLRKTSVKSGYN